MSSFEDTKLYQKNAIRTGDVIIMPGRQVLLRVHIRCSRCDFHYDVLDAVHDYKVTMRAMGETLGDMMDILKEDTGISDEDGHISSLESLMAHAMMIHAASTGHEIRLQIDEEKKKPEKGRRTRG